VGGHTSAAPLRCGYVTQAVGKWHMARTGRASRSTSASTTSTASCLCRHVHGVRDPYFFPRSSTARPHRMGQEHAVQQVFVHATRDGELEEVEESPSRSSRCSTTSGGVFRAIHRAHDGSADPWSSTTAPGSALRQLSASRLPGTFPAGTPTRTPSRTGRHLRAVWSPRSSAPQLESTMVVISSDNGPEMETWPDSAFTPFRCAKGSTWEAGCACRPSCRGRMIQPVAPATTRPSPRSVRTCLSMPGARANPHRPLHRRRRPALVPPGRRRSRGRVNRKFQHYWLTSQFSALRVGEYKYMLSSISDDDTTSSTRRFHRSRAALRVRRCTTCTWTQGDALVHDP